MVLLSVIPSALDAASVLIEFDDDRGRLWTMVDAER